MTVIRFHRHPRNSAGNDGGFLCKPFVMGQLSSIIEKWLLPARQ